MDFITVKVGCLPGRIAEVALNGGRKVSDALAGAEITDTEGFEIRVNSEIKGLDHKLSANDIVLLVKKIKGN